MPIFKEARRCQIQQFVDNTIINMANPMLATITFCHAILSALVSLRVASPIEIVQTKEDRRVSIDYSCPSVHVDTCLQSSNDTCVSLEEALINYYNTVNGQRFSADTPYQVFSVFDLFYSGLVNGDKSPAATSKDLDLDSAQVHSMVRIGCDTILRKVKLSQKDSDYCQWDYTCKYNPHYFPSFTVEAVLNEALSDQDTCEPLRARNLKFVRTDCLSDAGKSHWCHCNAGHVTVGYEHHHLF